MQNRHTVFSRPIPSTIKVADKPLLLGGVPKFISTNEFVKMMGMERWTETIEYQSIFEYQVTDTSYSLVQQVFHSIDQVRSGLVVCNMGAVGSGVFTEKDIPKGFFVAMYAGDALRDESSSLNMDYLLTVKEKDFEVIFDAGKIGNISRFFQHAPSSLTDYKFKGITHNQVCTENLNMVTVAHQNVIFNVFQAKRLIKKGEQLCFAYNDDNFEEYWMTKNIVPSLFKIDGSILSSDCYTFKSVIVKVGNSENTIIVKGVLEDVMSQLEIEPLKIESPDGNISYSVSKEEFYAAWDKKSPFVHLSRPSEAKLNPVMPNRLFQPAIKPADASIEKELNRILGSFLSEKFKYIEARKTAFIQVSDEDKLTKLAEYLSSKGLTVETGRNANTKQPLMYVRNPDINVLIGILEIEKSLLRPS